jgi:hypothetical protein
MKPRVKPGFKTKDETNPERVEFKCVNVENMGSGEVKGTKGYGMKGKKGKEVKRLRGKKG